MGIEEILKKNDAKRVQRRANAAERSVVVRAAFALTVETELVGALRKLNDKAIGEPQRLPIASKPAEIGIYFECEGLVRLTFHCVIRSDNSGDAFCSTLSLAMSRSGRTIRSAFDPIKPKMAARPHRLGYSEKQFGIDPVALQKVLEGMARQL